MDRNEGKKVQCKSQNFASPEIIAMVPPRKRSAVICRKAVFSKWWLHVIAYRHINTSDIIQWKKLRIKAIRISRENIEFRAISADFK